MTPAADLAAFAFEAIAAELFAPDGIPKPFILPPKANTQDDPFDRHVIEAMARVSGDVVVERAGPLKNPDSALRRGSLRSFAVLDPTSGVWRAIDTERLVGLEFKKLDKATFRKNPDYNSTPPCGVIRIGDAAAAEIDCRSFYAFVLLEPAGGKAVKATALAIVDGNLLNDDFGFYLDATGRTGKRTKAIALGSFADGTDRQRPMFIFPNPLALAELTSQATLVHARDDLASPTLERVGTIARTRRDGEIVTFTCYRLKGHSAADAFELADPFVAVKSTKTVSKRGTFRLTDTV